MSDKINVGDLVEVVVGFTASVTGSEWSVNIVIKAGSRLRVNALSEANEAFAVRIRNAATGVEMIDMWLPLDHVVLYERGIG